jgi:di/tricarboxylate transporter
MISESFQPYFVIITVTLLFFVIYKEYLRASVAFMLGVLLLTITGILTPREVLAGFSNESIASIIMLILITTGLRKNFQIELLFDLIFKRARTYRRFLFRMMTQVAFLSSVINNTPVVALMTPYVVDWGQKNNISPSKLLIPLSYAAIMGGMITLIGTSTTLVLNGFIQESGQQSMDIYDLLTVGIAVSVSGILFMVAFGYRLLPDHKDLLKSYSENRREFVAETRILPDSKLVGKSVRDAGLRNLKGVYLVEIQRDEREISPVRPEEVLQKNDILFFAGNTEDIVDLIHIDKGLGLPSTARSYSNDKTQVVEVVLTHHSSLIGRTVKKSDFRNRYDAAIVAIHRNGVRLTGRIGDVELEAGDLMLLYAGHDFRDRVDLYRDLYVISQLREINKPGKKKYYALAVSAVCALVLLFSGQFSLFPSLLIILSIMVGFRLIGTQDIKRELDLNMIVILVFSLALGQAIIKTNAGNMIADQIIALLKPHGTIAILIGLMIITNFITSLISNVGAVSITFPLAYAISTNLGLNPYPFYLGIAYTASAAFLTPIGYQTNLIIYGPGGYNFKDFFKIGLPINLIYLGVVIAVIILLYHDVLH